MEENIVTIEQAQKLKKLGYNIATEHIYNTDNEQLVWTHILSFTWQSRDNYIAAPSMFQVMLWFYRKYGIFISIRPNDFLNDDGTRSVHYFYDIFDVKFDISCNLLNSNGGYETPESAMEEAIDVVLDIISERIS